MSGLQPDISRLSDIEIEALKTPTDESVRDAVSKYRIAQKVIWVFPNGKINHDGIKLCVAGKKYRKMEQLKKSIGHMMESDLIGGVHKVTI